MNDLNNDFVLWISIGALVLTIVSGLAFAYKTARGMEGLEKNESKDD